MKRFRERTTTKWMALVLVILLPYIGFSGVGPSGTADPQAERETRAGKMERLLQWAVMDYQQGKYREVFRQLDLLLTFLDAEDGTENEKRLKGKVYLLKGAVYERTGAVDASVKMYRTARSLLPPGEESLDLDFSALTEYQRIFMEQKKTVKRQVIHKPVSKKKKRVVLWLTGAVILAGVAIYMLVKNKKHPEIQVERVENFDINELGIQWQLVPEGEFLMGDNFAEGQPDELPVHAVYLDKYYISKYEVTFAQYERFCQEMQRSIPDSGGWGTGDQPVINVTLNDAEDFCTWLSKKTGKTINLPSEAQWEKAARGTDQRRYSYGNADPTCEQVNYSCSGQPHPVGTHPADVSPYGVYDMTGNVSEWCRDSYDYYYYGASAYRNPVCRRDRSMYSSNVVRGGKWSDTEPSALRSARREKRRVTSVMSSAPYSRDNLGFRLVLTPR